MQIISTELDGVLIIKPHIFEDSRGFFFESYNEKTLAELGFNHAFVQDNHSRSRAGVLRGLHYQVEKSQGKLVRVVVGEVFDVAVDVRRHSATFGKWVSKILSAENKDMLWIPPGFAHGFMVISEVAELLYKVTDYYEPACERTIRWDDPDLGIRWPIKGAPGLSAKDAAGIRFKDAEFG